MIYMDIVKDKIRFDKVCKARQNLDLYDVLFSEFVEQLIMNDNPRIKGLLEELFESNKKYNAWEKLLFRAAFISSSIGCIVFLVSLGFSFLYGNLEVLTVLKSGGLIYACFSSPFIILYRIVCKQRELLSRASVKQIITLVCTLIPSLPDKDSQTKAIELAIKALISVVGNTKLAT